MLDNGVAIHFAVTPLWSMRAVSQASSNPHHLKLIHTVRFFLIATAIPLITTNGLYTTQWKCSHYATATTSPTPIQPIMSKNKSQSQIAKCEQALTLDVNGPLQRDTRWSYYNIKPIDTSKISKNRGFPKVHTSCTSLSHCTVQRCELIIKIRKPFVNILVV